MNNRAAPASNGDTVPAVEIGTSYFEQLYLYAFATQPEVIVHLRTQAVADELKRAPDILREWAALQPKIISLINAEGGLPDGISVQSLPASHANKAAEILSNDLTQKTFHLPTTIGLVEIDKLVAAQRTVHLGVVEQVQKEFPANPTMDDLIKICLLPRKKPPVQHLEIAPNVHSFSSESGDLRFLGGFLKELNSDDLRYLHGGGVPAAAIISFVGYGADPVNVFASGNRAVLNNGFHRVFALRRAGVTHVPVIIQRTNNPQLEFPPAVAGIGRDYLLTHPRPVLMKDFFADGFTVILKVRNRMRVVTAQVQASQHDVPA